MLKLMKRRILQQRTFTMFSKVSIKSVGVIGAGIMGSGIALTACHKAGLNVSIIDRHESNLSRSKFAHERILTNLVRKSYITKSNKNNTLKRINYTTKMNDIYGKDVVIEAVNE